MSDEDDQLREIVRKAKLRIQSGLLDPKLYQDGIVISDDMPNPVEGSVPSPCHHCGETVQISPDGQELLKRNPKLRSVCSACGFALFALGDGPHETMDVDEALRKEKEGEESG